MRRMGETYYAPYIDERYSLHEEEFTKHYEDNTHRAGTVPHPCRIVRTHGECGGDGSGPANQPTDPSRYSTSWTIDGQRLPGFG